MEEGNVQRGTRVDDAGSATVEVARLADLKQRFYERVLVFIAAGPFFSGIIVAVVLVLQHQPWFPIVTVTLMSAVSAYAVVHLKRTKDVRRSAYLLVGVTTAAIILNLPQYDPSYFSLTWIVAPALLAVVLFPVAALPRIITAYGALYAATILAARYLFGQGWVMPPGMLVMSTCSIFFLTVPLYMFVRLHERYEQEVAQNMAALQAARLDLSKFKLAVEQSSDAVLILDKDGYILYANAATVGTLGRISGDDLQSLWMSALGMERYTELWNRVSQEGTGISFEAKLPVDGSDTRTLFEVSVSPVMERNRLRYLVAVQRRKTG